MTTLKTAIGKWIKHYRLNKYDKKLIQLSTELAGLRRSEEYSHRCGICHPCVEARIGELMYKIDDLQERRKMLCLFTKLQ